MKIWKYWAPWKIWKQFGCKGRWMDAVQFYSPALLIMQFHLGNGLAHKPIYRISLLCRILTEVWGLAWRIGGRCLRVAAFVGWKHVEEIVWSQMAIQSHASGTKSTRQICTYMTYVQILVKILNFFQKQVCICQFCYVRGPGESTQNQVRIRNVSVFC